MTSQAVRWLIFSLIILPQIPAFAGGNPDHQGFVFETDGKEVGQPSTAQIRGTLLVMEEGAEGKRTVRGDCGMIVYLPGTSHIARVSASGYYSLSGIPIGIYSLWAESLKTGQKQLIANPLVVRGGSEDLEPFEFRLRRPKITRLARQSITVLQDGRMTGLSLFGTFGRTLDHEMTVTIGSVTLYGGQDFRRDEAGRHIQVLPSWGLGRRLFPLGEGWQEVRVIVNGIPSQPEHVYIRVSR